MGGFSMVRTRLIGGVCIMLASLAQALAEDNHEYEEFQYRAAASRGSGRYDDMSQQPTFSAAGGILEGAAAVGNGNSWSLPQHTFKASEFLSAEILDDSSQLYNQPSHTSEHPPFPSEDNFMDQLLREQQSMATSDPPMLGQAAGDHPSLYGDYSIGLRQQETTVPDNAVVPLEFAANPDSRRWPSLGQMTQQLSNDSGESDLDSQFRRIGQPALNSQNRGSQSSTFNTEENGVGGNSPDFNGHPGFDFSQIPILQAIIERIQQLLGTPPPFLSMSDIFVNRNNPWAAPMIMSQPIAGMAQTASRWSNIATENVVNSANFFNNLNHRAIDRMVDLMAIADRSARSIAAADVDFLKHLGDHNVRAIDLLSSIGDRFVTVGSSSLGEAADRIFSFARGDD